jgi:hypothetical protein
MGQPGGNACAQEWVDRPRTPTTTVRFFARYRPLLTGGCTGGRRLDVARSAVAYQHVQLLQNIMNMTLLHGL